MENVLPRQTTPYTQIFEEIWATLGETAKRQKENEMQIQESRTDFDRQMQERRADFDRQMEKSKADFESRMKETDRYIKEIGNGLGYFTNRFGDVVQHMIAPNLLEKFLELGYDFQEASTKHKVRDKKNDIKFEIDVFLQNGDTAMLVEIKADLTISDINKHITRLEKMRKYADLRGDKRRFLGAVAGIVVEDNEREYALSQGFYLIEPSGENFNITPPFNKPKEW